MQPYFLPYLGYWQLMAAVDRFVVYDNIQYTKKGWINRNRFLRDGEAVTFTLPLKKASDFLDVADRSLADDFDPKTILNPVTAAYRKAPFFAEVLPWLENVVAAPPRNLFEYLHHSLKTTAAFLDIKTPIVVSSTVPADHRLKSEDRVIALCEAQGATAYVNPPGGRDLYSAEHFARRGMALKFIQPRLAPYPQFDRPFVSGLSILDVLMFNSRESVCRMLDEYELETVGVSPS